MAAMPTQQTQEPAPEPGPPRGDGGPPRGGAPSHGPTGKEVSPGLVIVLILVTLGIYVVFWGWNRTKEADAYTGGQAEAHDPFKKGFWLGAGAFALAVVGLMMAVVGGISVEPDSLTGFWAGIGLMVLAGIAGLVAAVFTCIGYWRLWRFVEHQERELGAMNPLSPVRMLALLFIPLVNIVGVFYVPYRTQRGLNTIWQGGSGPGPGTDLGVSA